MEELRNLIIRECQDCGEEFPITVGVQQLMKARGIDMTKVTRCKSCYYAFKKRHRNDPEILESRGRKQRRRTAAPYRKTRDSTGRRIQFK